MKALLRSSAFISLTFVSTFIPATGNACQRHCYEIVTMSDGTEISVWEDVKDGKPVICSSSFCNGKSGVTSVILPNGYTQNAIDPQIRADKLGNVIVAWKANDPRIKKNVLLVTYRSEDGTWIEPFPISDLEESVENGFTLMINDSGLISLIWTAFFSEETSPRVRATTGGVTTGFKAPITISL